MRRIFDFAFSIVVVAFDWPWTKLWPWGLFIAAWKLSADVQHVSYADEQSFVDGVETYLAIRIAEETERQR